MAKDVGTEIVGTGDRRTETSAPPESKAINLGSGAPSRRGARSWGKDGGHRRSGCSRRRPRRLLADREPGSKERRKSRRHQSFAQKMASTWSGCNERWPFRSARVAIRRMVIGSR